MEKDIQSRLDVLFKKNLYSLQSRYNVCHMSFIFIQITLLVYNTRTLDIVALKI